MSKETITDEETAQEAAVLLDKLEDACVGNDGVVIGLAISGLAAKWVHIYAEMNKVALDGVLGTLFSQIGSDVHNMVRKQ